MRIEARTYRDEAYRLKSHPTAFVSVENNGFDDKRDSFSAVYWSVFPFLALEYVAEASLDLALSGLMFPTGFLLFWAFFYTYYRPGSLEERLSAPGKFGLNQIFSVLFGVAIWFVKISVVSLLDFVLGLVGLQLPKRKRRSGTSSNVRRLKAVPREASRAHAPARPPRAEPKQTPRPAPKPPLPMELTFALSELGLKDCRDWTEIHRRYRELAKKFHPDHNTDRERAAKYFIRVDTAYRTLSKNRAKYFAAK